MTPRRRADDSAAVVEADAVVVDVPHRQPVSRGVLLAAVILSACIALIGGALGAWVIYRASGPAVITQVIGTGSDGKPSTVSQLAATSANSVVTIVTQPATAQSIAGGQSVSNGVIVSSDGLILTSVDAVRGATQLRVGTADGHGFDATIVATDAAHGLALLRAVGATGLKTLNVSASQPHPGDVAIVVSAPSITGIHVDVTSVVGAGTLANPTGVLELATFHGVDVVGAPVIDGSGNVVGVTASGATVSGNETADATAATAATLIAAQPLVSDQALGANYVYIAPGVAAAIKSTAGDLILSITDGGPAAVAGLRAGDIVTTVNGSLVDASHPLAPSSFGLSSGATATLGVVRTGAPVTLTIVIPTS